MVRVEESVGVGVSVGLALPVSVTVLEMVASGVGVGDGVSVPLLAYRTISWWWTFISTLSLAFYLRAPYYIARARQL